MSPHFHKIYVLFASFTLFASLPILTLMHLCIMLYMYWTPLHVEAGLVDDSMFAFTGLAQYVASNKFVLELSHYNCLRISCMIALTRTSMTQLRSFAIAGPSNSNKLPESH